MKAFIFDFDGVIVDSEKYWIELDDTFFPSIAPLYDREHAKNMMGLGTEAGYQYLHTQCRLTISFEEYEATLENAVRDIYADKSSLIPGVETLIIGLLQRAIPIGIASSSKRKWIDLSLTRLNVAQYFKIICSNDDVQGRTKPLPDLYLLAAKQVNVDPSECVALEDSKNGIASAKAAGMYCIGLRTSMSAKQDLSGADRIVSSVDEIDPEIIFLEDRT